MVQRHTRAGGAATRTSMPNPTNPPWTNYPPNVGGGGFKPGFRVAAVRVIATASGGH